MNTIFLDRTAGGLPIPAFTYGHGGWSVLILAGVHGDEREGIELALGLVDRWRQSFPFDLTVTVVPALNLDGVLRGDRRNARGVDLNRNIPTRDWSPVVATPRYHPGPSAGSEPETKALIQLIERARPRYILSLHSFKNPMLNINGACRDVAAAAADVCGYPLEESIGYPTPGCLGTYAGLERDVPTITYELERGMPTADILRTHVDAVIEALEFIEQKSRTTP